MANNSIELTSRYGMNTEEFSALMKYRIIEILLVASHYDSFILEEDGQLTELVIQEYRSLDLNLRFAPRFTRAASATEALRLIDERNFDMVITTPRMPDMEITELVHQIPFLTADRILMPCLYALVYSLFLLAISSAVFDRKDLM